jgi:hypothetical protein
MTRLAASMRRAGIAMLQEGRALSRTGMKGMSRNDTMKPKNVVLTIVAATLGKRSGPRPHTSSQLRFLSSSLELGRSCGPEVVITAVLGSSKGRLYFLSP